MDNAKRIEQLENKVNALLRQAVKVYSDKLFIKATICKAAAEECGRKSNVKTMHYQARQNYNKPSLQPAHSYAKREPVNLVSPVKCLNCQRTGKIARKGHCNDRKARVATCFYRGEFGICR